MLINDSETWYYLDASGHVLEGDRSAPAGAASLLVAAGGQLDEEAARKHGLVGTLKNLAEYDHRDPVSGERLALVGGRAFARRLVEPPTPAPVPRPEAKHVAGPPETKAVGGPEAPHSAPPVAPGPGNAAKPEPAKPAQSGK
jgi:hypothetical protein